MGTPEVKPRRILVTGSRDWADAAMIRRVLLGFANTGDTLVHGGLRSGADFIAEGVWQRYDVGPIEVHPVTAAMWSKAGPAAGPTRNRAMVDSGVDLCLAFIGPCTSRRCPRADAHGSHGATGCADYAQRQGVPTYRYYPEVARAAARR